MNSCSDPDPASLEHLRRSTALGELALLLELRDLRTDSEARKILYQAWAPFDGLIA
jgi:hypothetical protein